jgi:CelD/BcsL family acetyltransferase involved in cellulose biosynthesis
VKSWLTGRRLVSVPFSDHCDPLIDSQHDIDLLAGAVEDEIRRGSWNYAEVRPLRAFDLETRLSRTTITYTFHELDLGRTLDVIFQGLHKSSTQRKVRRAEREGLRYSEGTSDDFLEHFYRLLISTRRRHRLPPQPKAWFTNLIACFGKALKIRLACRGDLPIAAIMTIAYKETLAYKYGCSDSQFNNLGGMHLLLWKAIEDAKGSGLQFLDFGRTDADQESLVTFKNRWGASQSVLTYSRYGNSGRSTHSFDLSATRWKAETAKYMLSKLPSRLVSEIGRALYGHIG